MILKKVPILNTKSSYNSENENYKPKKKLNSPEGR